MDFDNAVEQIKEMVWNKYLQGCLCRYCLKRKQERWKFATKS
jgi:hypothetical protein